MVENFTVTIKTLRGKIGGEHNGKLNREQSSLRVELETLRSLQHPNVVAYLGGRVWFDGAIVSILIEENATTLKSLLITSTDMNFDDAVRDIMSGLAYLHLKHVFNSLIYGLDSIQVRNVASRKRFVICNFGEAKISASLGNLQDRHLNPVFIAPECLLCAAESHAMADLSMMTCPKCSRHSSDVWTLGIVLLCVESRQDLSLTVNKKNYIGSLLRVAEPNAIEFIETQFGTLSQRIKQVLACSAVISAAERPTVRDIAGHLDIEVDELDEFPWRPKHFKKELTKQEQWECWTACGDESVKSCLTEAPLNERELVIEYLPCFVTATGTATFSHRRNSGRAEVRYLELMADKVSNSNRFLHQKAEQMVAMKKLLGDYPNSRRQLIWTVQEQLPLSQCLRPFVWAACLDVKKERCQQYCEAQVGQELDVDRQLDLDIPRCHQYDILLSTMSGRQKLRRILKTWSTLNPDMRYGQGLDSLCAPFARLCFNDEPMAFTLFDAFVRKYCGGLFTTNNCAEMNYMFSLSKIFHLWDYLLTQSSTCPFLVGLTILKFLRERLMKCSYNDCIALFADLPEIPIEQLVSETAALAGRFPFDELRTLQNCESPTDEYNCCHLSQYKGYWCPSVSAELVRVYMDQPEEYKSLIIDPRPIEQYLRCTLRNSLRPSPSLVQRLENFDGLIVLIGDRQGVAKQLSRDLIKRGYQNVCVLEKGVQEFFDTSYLIVPMFGDK